MGEMGSSSIERVSIRPGVSVLSVLRHLNYTPWFALAELVDNALQSYIEHRAALTSVNKAAGPLRVAIGIDSSAPGRIVVRDNAAGISYSHFPRAFRPAAIPPDRSGLCEFGMGMKSAACWLAPHWHVRTKALYEPIERTIRFDISRIVRDEIEELQIEERPAEPEAHYTEIVLEGLYHIPVGRTIGKLKEHLTDIYRVFMRRGDLALTLNGEALQYEEPPILMAPYYKTPAGPDREWRKVIHFELEPGLAVHGFAALRDPGNYAKSGFALFRRGRLIEGSGEDGYRPPLIFGTSGSSSYTRLRLFGELHLDGFEVSHTKDGFRWHNHEEPFLELLRQHLDSDELPLLQQCESYRALASKRDRTLAATQASAAIIKSLPQILPAVAAQEPVETRTEPLKAQPTLATRELKFTFRGEPWRVVITLSDDPAEGDWLALCDPTSDTTDNTLELRVSMAHPFMINFAQTDVKVIEPLLRVAAALALAEKFARLAGVKSAGTLRRNVNEILREGLSAL